MSTEAEDLALVFDHYGVQYRDRSGNQPIKCPVHEDRDPSASADLSKGLWTCHACGAGGDSITLIQLREGGVTYQAAKRILESITGRSDTEIRDERRARREVVAGTGYRPRVFRKVPPGLRRKPSPWAREV